MRGSAVYFIASHERRLVKIDIAEIWQNVLNSCSKPSDYVDIASGVLCFALGSEESEVYYVLDTTVKLKSVFVGRAKKKLTSLRTADFEITGFAVCRQCILIVGVSPDLNSNLTGQYYAGCGSDQVTYELVSRVGINLDVLSPVEKDPLYYKPRHIKLMPVDYSILGIVTRMFGKLDVIAIIHNKLHLITTVDLPDLPDKGEYAYYQKSKPGISGLIVDRRKKGNFRIILSANWNVMISHIVF